MFSEKHVLTFTRDNDRAMQVKSYRNAVDLLIDGISTKTLRQRGWSFDEDISGFVAVDASDAETNYRYQWKLNVNYSNVTAAPNKTEFAGICFTLYGRAIKPAGGRWTLTHVDGSEYQPPSDDDSVSSQIDKEMIGYADCTIPDDWSIHFEHLYGMDNHVSRLRRSIAAGIQSQWKNRFNTVLIGPPGCGKSDIALSMKEALGTDAVKSFDATATTAAGMIKELDELEILPRVIILEEIEKASEGSLLPLLAILDQRGEVRKTTARGKIEKSTKVLGIATVNDEEKFEKLQAGALASRFSNKIYFDRPPREIALQILRREIAKVEGDQEWAEPAYDYCEDHGIEDIRQMIAICLCGADGLLDGTFVKEMDATSKRPE